MRNHTCPLDHHQRSHCDTITIGPEGMMNWVLQLNTSQSVNSFNSLVEKFNMQNSPNQPKPNPICDRSGNLITREMCLLLKAKRTVPTRSMKKVFTENSVPQNDQGNLIICLKTPELGKLTMDQGKLDERNSSSTHMVKAQNAPDVHRDITLLNTDNEFNRAINEEDIDFNIPGLPHSVVKQLLGANVQDLIHKIENHRHALQRDLQQRQRFNIFSQESKDMIREVGNIELCELLDVEPRAQCRICLSYWDVSIVYCTCGHFLRNGTEENKKFVQYTMDLLSIPNCYIKKERPHGHRYGKKPGDHEYFTANSLQKCKKKQFLGIHDRFIRDARFRKTMTELGRTEEVIREMDKLANEDHTHQATAEEFCVYRSNWWMRSNIVGSDTMPVRH